MTELLERTALRRSEMRAAENGVGRIGFDHVGIVVSDMDRYVEWYSEAFDLKPELEFVIREADIRGIVLISPAGWRLELFERTGSRPSGRAADPLGQHLT